MAGNFVIKIWQR